jgi:PilZ domain
MHIDRRRSPRIELLGRLQGHSVSLEVPIVVREISLGGMAIETSEHLPAGSIHEFRLTLGDDSVVELLGRVMHSRNTALPDATPVFVTGVQFIDDHDDQAHTVSMSFASQRSDGVH